MKVMKIATVLLFSFTKTSKSVANVYLMFKVEE